MAVEPPNQTEREQRLDEVLGDYLEAVENGTAPSREELLRSHPDLADDLRAFLDADQQFDSLMAPLRQVSLRPSGSDRGLDGRLLPGLPPAGPATPRQVGDYELLDEVARGGMGVVWRARQASLNRIVAVKTILAGRLRSEERRVGKGGREQRVGRQ